nr:retrovirus-related Pol polyprotein from transposon TNT 1-94 [Tanacetum cinerariifolium]
MDRGFLSQKGSGVRRGVKEKQVLMADKSAEGEKHVNVVNAGLESFPTVSKAHGFQSLDSNEENMNDVGTTMGPNPAGNTPAYGFFLGKKVPYPVVANYNNLLILKKWHPDENILKEDVSTVSVWVKLHDGPVTAFNEDGLSAIATKLGCDVALQTLPTDMKAGEKATLMKKAYNTLILCLGDWIKHLMLLTSLSLFYENFVETLLYGRESFTMEDVLATLNSKELKKRTEGAKEEIGDGLYVKGRSDHSGSSKKRLSNEEVKWVRQKGKRNQDSDSSDEEGNAYFREALAVVGNDEMTDLVMDSCGSYHMTHKRDFLYDFKVVDDGSVQLGLYCKMQLGRIKVIKGCRVMMTGMRKKNCVYTLEAKVMTFGVQKHGGSKQVKLKQVGSKKVGFKQLGHKQVGFKQLGPGVETGVHGVQDEKRVWFEVELQRAQGDREAKISSTTIHATKETPPTPNPSTSTETPPLNPSTTKSHHHRTTPLHRNPAVTKSRPPRITTETNHEVLRYHHFWFAKSSRGFFLSSMCNSSTAFC